MSKKKGKGGSREAPSNGTNSTTTKQQEEGLHDHTKCCSKAHWEALSEARALKRDPLSVPSIVGLRSNVFDEDIVSAWRAEESMRNLEERLLEDGAIRRKKLELLSQSAEEAPYMYCGMIIGGCSVERESPKPL